MAVARVGNDKGELRSIEACSPPTVPKANGGLVECASGIGANDEPAASLAPTRDAAGLK